MAPFLTLDFGTTLSWLNQTITLFLITSPRTLSHHLKNKIPYSGAYQRKYTPIQKYLHNKKEELEHTDRFSAFKKHH